MDSFNDPNTGTLSPINSQENILQSDFLAEIMNMIHNPTLNSSIIHDKPATGKLPSIEDYPGYHNFKVEVNMSSSERKYEYSPTLNKLFVNMDINVFITFTLNVPSQDNLFIRALPVYTDTQFIEDPVLRCCHHSTLTLDCNKNFPYVHHVIRSTHDKTSYELNEESKRMSVVVPLDQPQAGSTSTNIVYRFVCKNSCSSGMNRRNTQIIFTLENINGIVFGRKKLGMRICSCPKRDREKEETAYFEEINSMQQGYSRKRKKKNEPQLINDLKKIKVEEMPEQASPKYQLIISDREKAIKLKQIADIIFNREDTILKLLE